MSRSRPDTVCVHHIVSDTHLCAIWKVNIDNGVNVSHSKNEIKLEAAIPAGGLQGNDVHHAWRELILYGCAQG